MHQGLIKVRLVYNDSKNLVCNRSNKKMMKSRIEKSVSNKINDLVPSHKVTGIGSEGYVPSERFHPRVITLYYITSGRVRMGQF